MVLVLIPGASEVCVSNPKLHLKGQLAGARCPALVRTNFKHTLKMADVNKTVDKGIVNDIKPNRDLIAKGLRADLNMVLSLVHGLLSEEDLFEGLVDVYFERWQKAYNMKPENPNSNDEPR